MSTTYSIACKNCRKHLWIAQSSGDHSYVYGGEKHLVPLNDFLFAHMGHDLVFGYNCEGDIAEMEEIETKE